MINNRNKSVVTDIQWNKTGEKIGIIYKDGIELNVIIIIQLLVKNNWTKFIDHYKVFILSIYIYIYINIIYKWYKFGEQKKIKTKKK